jgi:hypothetical protein
MITNSGSTMIMKYGWKNWRPMPPSPNIGICHVRYRVEVEGAFYFGRLMRLIMELDSATDRCEVRKRLE